MKNLDICTQYQDIIWAPGHVVAAKKQIKLPMS